MKKISTQNEYRSLFDSGEVGGEEMKQKIGKEKAEILLEKALEVRKFEIELYWKRTTYFWAFIGIAFAGYISIMKDNSTASFEILYFVGCIGLILSLSWYYVNRGSKFWQSNWELHVDLLENEVYGPLYKTTISKDKYHYWNLCSPFPFSVSKINQILSMFSVVIWLLLLVNSFEYFCCYALRHKIVLGIMSIISLSFIAILFVKGKTESDKGKKDFEMESREYK